MKQLPMRPSDQTKDENRRTIRWKRLFMSVLTAYCLSILVTVGILTAIVDDLSDPGDDCYGLCPGLYESAASHVTSYETPEDHILEVTLDYMFYYTSFYSACLSAVISAVLSIYIPMVIAISLIAVLKIVSERPVTHTILTVILSIPSVLLLFFLLIAMA